MTSPASSEPGPASAIPPAPAALPFVTAPVSPGKLMVKHFLTAAILVSISLLLIATALWAFNLVRQYDFPRNQCLTCWVITGVAATICLAAAMHCFNMLLAVPQLRWPITLPLRLGKRLILLAQLVTTALALAPAGLWYFHVAIPRNENVILDPSWSPPPEEEPDEMPLIQDGDLPPRSAFERFLR